MPGSILRLIVLSVWLVSIGAAFWAGRHLESKGPEKTTPTENPSPAITLAPGSPEGAGTEPDDSGGGTETKPAAVHDAREVLAQARREMGPGMSSMMNPSTMFRALGPLMTLPASEIRGALAEVSATVTDSQQRAMFQSLLLSRWAEEDPKAALAYAEKLSTDGGPMESQALMSVVSTWAKREPEAAWDWYLKRRDSDEAPLGPNGFDSSLMAIFGATAATNLDSALAKLALLDDDSSRNMALMGIALSSVDAEKRKAVLARSESLDPDTKLTLRQQVVSQWAYADPGEVMEWLRAQPAEDRSSVTDRVSYALMGNNPEKAAAFLMEDATEDNLGRRYSAIVSAWANRDPIAAGEWLNRQPKSAAQDQARMNFANHVIRIDPAAAMEWAKSIEGEGMRQNSVQNVYQQWRRRDADAAESALVNSGLPDDKIEKIRTQVKK